MLDLPIITTDWMACTMRAFFLKFYLETTLPTILPLMHCLNSMSRTGNFKLFKKQKHETSSRSIYGQLSGL
ncbi:hypothetical protein SAMN04487891_11077 [Flagellimonas taeanensis]|uniref:Uncharacterized protein n=1 Tax=Flagellimonas taeanensis TaxID=1005926 RepID=A0A1M7BAB3_9FLAO|nr:hypothetical protein SAMN04487891_11077 [Allomuricauda taeanensis]SHL51871.1 hypothetical protein SAMN05216293_3639 [Allomuricauda taeanensis]